MDLFEPTPENIFDCFEHPIDRLSLPRRVLKCHALHRQDEMTVVAKHRRDTAWFLSKYVETEGEEAFELSCRLYGVHVHPDEVIIKTSRAGSPQDAVERVVTRESKGFAWLVQQCAQHKKNVYTRPSMGTALLADLLEHFDTRRLVLEQIVISQLDIGHWAVNNELVKLVTPTTEKQAIIEGHLGQIMLDKGPVDLRAAPAGVLPSGTLFGLPAGEFFGQFTQRGGPFVPEESPDELAMITSMCISNARAVAVGRFER